MKKYMSDDITKIIGKSLLLASIQVSIGSVEMSSKFSVQNFAKDQATLQRAADALRGYIFIGGIWLIGCVMILCSQYGWVGFVSSFLANIGIMAWIVSSYIMAFRSAAETYNLEMPKLF